VNSNPLVSVIIPAYNREKTISYCLDSVLNQTYTNLEVLIVDDCSTDGTIKMIESYNDNRIKIIKLDKNSGAQAARNKGIREAKANWIAFLDSDDEWFLDKIERQINIIKQHNWDPFLVLHSDAIRYNTITNTKKEFGIKKINGKNVYKDLLIGPAPFFPTMLTSKRALESINYLDENVPSYQEWDTSIRLAEKCEFIFLKEPTFLYYFHSGETISKNLLKDIEGYEYIIKKFESKINKYCGKKVWFNHIKVQYNKCIDWGFSEKAKYYLNQSPFFERIRYNLSFFLLFIIAKKIKRFVKYFRQIK
jgi:glycosyltransferase involved in cell wall biosynthesis